jgi:hypothetical protein
MRILGGDPACVLHQKSCAGLPPSPGPARNRPSTLTVTGIPAPESRGPTLCASNAVCKSSSSRVADTPHDQACSRRWRRHRAPLAAPLAQRVQTRCFPSSCAQRWQARQRAGTACSRAVTTPRARIPAMRRIATEQGPSTDTSHRPLIAASLAPTPWTAAPRTLFPRGCWPCSSLTAVAEGARGLKASHPCGAMPSGVVAMFPHSAVFSMYEPQLAASRGVLGG